MEYARTLQGGSAVPRNAFTTQGQGMFIQQQRSDDDQVGYELEQTAMAALKDFDTMNSSQTHNGRWSGYQYELNASAPTFELRQQNESSVFSSQVPSKPQQMGMVPGPSPQQSQGLQQSAPPRSPQKQGSTSAFFLSQSSIEADDHRGVADFILKSKANNEASALDFLRGVFLAIANPTEAISVEDYDWHKAVRNGPPYLTPEDQAAAKAHSEMNQHNSMLLQAQRSGIPPRPPPISLISLIGDEIDQRSSTLVILVPGRSHIVGHLIGKGGAEINKIEREMSVTVKIEGAAKMGVQLVERSVCIIGAVASTTLAQQLVSHKVHEKLLSEGVQAEVLKMVVPNEIVRHLIGKNGANINRLQTESGARIQVEPETTIATGQVGRTIVLQGTERCRTFAQYLILRQIAEDRNVHSEWAGRIQGTSVGSQSPGAGHSFLGLAGQSGSAPSPPNMVGRGPASPIPVAQLGMRTQQPSPAPGVSIPFAVDEEVSVFSVPERAVAFLIGRNGSSVMEIQKQTGARVHIARNTMPNGSSTEETRQVTVSGSALAVSAAQQMIRNRAQLATAGGAGAVSPQHHQM